MNRDLAALETAIAEFDARLRPLARRRVDITRPGWADKLRTQTPPLDEVGIRSSVAVLLATVLKLYAEGGDPLRQELRQLFARYASFTWAAGSVPDEPTTDAGFRQHLLLLSLRDHGQDTRDEILQLQWLCATAQKSGVAINRVLEEIAALSSDVDKYGMGSMKTLFLNARQPPQA